MTNHKNNPKNKSNANAKDAKEKSGFERKVDRDGRPNPKYVDLLEVDKPIAGQNFGCFSFLTPEKIIKQKEMFYFDEFLKKWEFSKAMEKFTQFLNFLSFKYKVSFEDIMKDYEEFVEEEKESIRSSSVEDDFKTFLDRNETELEKQFNIKHNFQTSVRGFKSRGNFATQEEAELRAKLLREVDPAFDIFVGPVGQWLCWDPDAYKTGRTEYMEEELNQLMAEKIKNEAVAKTAFEQRVKDAKKKAIEDNIKNAEKSGNPLTQTIDENGNLIGVGARNTQEAFLSQRNKENDSISISDIRAELFDGDNIVVGKTDYGQSELISGPFATTKTNENKSV
jgi:adenylate kinase family enzyme